MKRKSVLRRLVSSVIIMVMMLTMLPDAMPTKVSAAASSKNLASTYFNATTKYLHLGDEKTGSFNFNIKKEAKKPGATYTWYVKADKGNPKAVSINRKNGVVTAKEAGTAYIRCKITFADGSYIRPEAKVTVRNNITGVKIKNLPDDMTISAGITYDFNRTILNTKAGKGKKTGGITRWEIQDDTAGVVSASDKGIVYPVQSGEFNIRAVSFQSKAKHNSWLEDKEINKKFITASSDWHTIMVESSDGQAIANTQEQLNKALLSDEITDITLSSEKGVLFTIEEGDYSTKSLTVDTPKADIENHGIFKEITIKDIKDTTWIEYTDGNIVYLLDDNLTFVIDKDAKIKRIVVDTPNSVVNFEIHGQVDMISVLQPSQINLSGDSKNVPISIEENAEGSKIASSVSLDLTLNANTEIVLDKGAEETKIDKSASSVKVQIENKSEKAIVITTNKTNPETIESNAKGTSSEETVPTPVPFPGGGGGGGDNTPLSNLTEYNKALMAVVEDDYTVESWAEYQKVVKANVVTTSTSQTKVDEATRKIKTAQDKLVVAVDSVEISGANTVEVGKTITLTAKVMPENATEERVTWLSKNEDIATVDIDKGIVTGVATGSAIILVTTFDGNKTDEHEVNVVEKGEGPEVLVSAISVEGTGDATTIETNGDTLQMIATVSPDNASNKAVTWTVTETDGTATDKATISNTGLLTAKANGTVTVTATAQDGSGKSDSIDITITNQIGPDKNITSVATLAEINVAYGTNLSGVSLPTTVGVTLEDSTTRNLAVTWNGGTPSYNGNTAGDYVFEGTLTLEAGVKNTSSLKATIKVIVAEQEKVVLPIITPSKTSATNRETGVTFTVGDVSGVTFHYTLDGTEPKSSSTKYSSAVTLTAPDNDVVATINIKVIGIKADAIDSDVATATVTYAAKGVTTYTVTVNNGSGSGDYAKDAIVSITANAPAAGKVFDKWTSLDVTFANASNASTTFVMPAKAVTVEATYKTKEYTVIFKDYDDTDLKTQTVEHGSGATAPEAPTRTGYTFAGWSGTYTDVTKAETVLATYTESTDTPYKVEHYKYTENGYTLAETDSSAGTTAAQTTATAKAYTGFIAKAFDQTAIAADGTTVVRIEYDKIIDKLAISGVKAPVKGEMPTTTITASDQYTGSISWSPEMIDGKFAPNTIYTASIKLSPKTGYSLEGVGKDVFTLAGATTTNNASSGDLLAVFPKTAPAEITGSVSITGDTKFEGLLTANISDISNVGTPIYAWYRADDLIAEANTETYTLVEGDIGKTITVVISADDLSGTIASSPTQTIDKADGLPAPTGLGKTDVTTIARSDGTLTGTNDRQEYRKEGDGSWSSITGGTVTGLAPGTYYVRFKESQTHYVGVESQELVVGISDQAKVDYAVSQIIARGYEIPYENQTSEDSKKAWVQGQVSQIFTSIKPEDIRASSASVSVTAEGYTLTVTSGSVEKTVTLPVTQALQPIAGTITINGDFKFGQTLSATIENGNFDNAGVTTYKWQHEGSGEVILAESSSYTLVEGDIGKTMAVEVSNTERAGALIGQTASPIQKADGPNAPTGIGAEKSAGFDEYVTKVVDDGKLTGVTPGQEYKGEGADGWTPITEANIINSNIEGLAHGKYLIRVAETSTHKAGAPTEPILVDLTDVGKYYTDSKSIEKILPFYIPLSTQGEGESSKEAYIKGLIENSQVIKYSELGSVGYQSMDKPGIENYSVGLKAGVVNSQVPITAYLLGSWQSLDYKIIGVDGIKGDAEEGDGVNQVAVGSKAVLGEAISEAQAVLDSGKEGGQYPEDTVGVKALEDAQNALDAALVTFEAGRVKR